MKKLIALISTVAVFATMSLTTMAAADVSVTGDITNDNGTYTTATEATAANGQTTIIAVKGTTIDTNSIQYINQGTEKNFSFQLKDAEALANVAEETTINVYVGGDKIAKTPVGTIVFKPQAVTPEVIKIQLGDCDGVAGIDLRDATAIKSHFLGEITLADDATAGTYYFTAASMADGVAGIDLRDATAVKSHFLGEITLGEYEVK